MKKGNVILCIGSSIIHIILLATFLIIFIDSGIINTRLSFTNNLSSYYQIRFIYYLYWIIF
jgi:hypothetical protein